MKKQDKELLLKDLCARLPYGVEVKSSARKKSITLSLDVMVDFYLGYSVKPYLRPMSSITEEEWKEFDWFVKQEPDELIRFRNTLKFYTKNHIDYGGLIPMGLALPAPEGMYDF